MPAQLLERITDGYVEYKIFFAPIATPKIYLVKYPPFGIRQVGLSYRKRQIKSKYKEIEIVPEPNTRSNCYLF